MSPLLDSTRRVEALSELSLRQAALIAGLSAAVTGVLGDVDPAVRARLERAIAMANSQFAAADDALSRAIDDLPEGGSS